MLFLLIYLNKKVKNDLDMKEEPCLRTPRGVWALLLTLSLRTTPFGGFPDEFGLSLFWPLTFLLRKKDKVH